MHLAIDGYGGSSNKLDNKDSIYEFLDSYPAKIGMTKITSPRVYRHEARDSLDSGVSGFVLIAESHISIHTFPKREYVNIDVFSCKDFDLKKAVRELKKMFNLDKVRVWALERGLEYSDIATAKKEINFERSRVIGNPRTGGSETLLDS
tara:strand:+ start:660 stop:1106 length:447 start_codon:yes stop_codon:yes gene_type:complete